MRKTSLAAATVAVVSLFTFFQIACQPAADTNRSESLAPNTNSGRETVDTASIEAELLRIENDWPRVIKEKDVAAVGRVEADDVVIVYPDGNVGSKQQDLNDIGSGALTADDIDISDLKVRVLDSDAAVVSGQTEIKNGTYKMPDGKLMDITGKYRFVDTFARRNGEWKLVAGISTKITAPPATSASPAASPAVRASPAASPTVRAPSPRSSPVATATP
jgi:ketosteroid isomerase-like protein